MNQLTITVFMFYFSLVKVVFIEELSSRSWMR